MAGSSPVDDANSRDGVVQIREDVSLKGQNLAFGRPCAFSVAPNYRLCTDAEDVCQLTDGFRLAEGTKGALWTRKTSVGWNNREPQIVVDLGERLPISGFGYNLAAGSSGVQWPRAVDVYVSDDNATWRYAGDVYQKSCARTGAPDPTRYSVYHAVSCDMPAVGRYVMFVPSFSGYGFVDEVEVFRGPDSFLDEPPNGPVVTDFKAFFNAKCIPLKLCADLQTLSGRAAALSPEARVAFEMDVRALRTQAEAVPDATELAAQRTVLPLNATHTRIWALNARLLRAAGIEKPFVWKNCRWDNLDPFEIPRSQLADSVELELMKGETRSETINVVNPTDCELTCDLDVLGLSDDLSVNCREVVFTDTKDLRTVAAVLRPNGSRRLHFAIPAGVSKQVWITVRRPRVSGRQAGVIRVDLGRGTVLMADLAVIVRDVGFPKNKSLLMGGWDYLEGNSRVNEVSHLELLRDMRQNLPCARGGVLPRNPTFDEKGELVNPEKIDLSRWDAWTAKFPWASSYLVFAAVGESFHGEPMTSPRFARMVGSYYAAFAAALRARRVDTSHVVIQLIDESHAHRTDDIHIAWAKAIRARTDAFRLMVNPIWEKPQEARPAFFELSDVICPWRGYLTDKTRSFYRALAEKGKELWVYSCTGPVRTFDPVAYYRTQAWEAFAMGGDGSLFWQFGNFGDSWRAYWQPGVEYSPYFISPDGATAAKHSEALMEGSEDFALLAMARDAVSALKSEGQDASQLESTLNDGVRRVLKESEGGSFWGIERNREVADAVRIEILCALERACLKGEK